MKRRIIATLLTLAMTLSLLCSTTAYAANSSVSCLEDTNLLGSGKIVYYPTALESSDTTYPVIVWANGTGCVTGVYATLLQTFAAAGYIVVADTTVMSADGTDQIDSVDYILALNEDASSIFYGKVDADKIGAAGHSQGGRSAVNAAAADSRIVCVLSIAGSSYTSEAKACSTPVFFMTGTADLVVASSLWVKPAYNAVQGSAVYASLRSGVHTTCITNSSKLSGYAVEWFNAWLKDDAAAMAVFASGGTLSKDSAWTGFACK